LTKRENREIAANPWRTEQLKILYSAAYFPHLALQKLAASGFTDSTPRAAFAKLCAVMD
jgi:hypothetical protein